jgi:hypothetical protein
MDKFGKIEPFFGCLMPVLRHATGNAEFNKGRQMLADTLFKLYNKIVKPLEDKMVDAALTKVMKLFEKHVLQAKKVQDIITKTKALVMNANKALMDVATEKMKLGGTEAMKIFDISAKKSQGFWKLQNLIPMLLKPMKDFVTSEVLKQLTNFYYIVWDALLNWAGPLVLRAATVALDEVCSTANVALEWLCSGGLELAQDVFFWVSQQLRELGKKLMTDIFVWVVDFSEKHVLKNLGSVLKDGLKKVDNAIAKVESKTKKAVNKLKAKFPDYSKLIPRPMKKFFSGLFLRTARKLYHLMVGEGGKSMEKLFDAAAGLLGAPMKPDKCGNYKAVTFSPTKKTLAPTKAICPVTSWSKWSACSKKCGGGKRTRSRTITPKATSRKVCPKLTDTGSCNKSPCPVDCKVNSWGAWSSCSKTCAGGKATRTRSVKQAAKNGGKKCPSLSGTKVCNSKHCPVDCVVASWAGWPSCSKTCGGGTQTTTRKVLVANAYGGKACPQPLKKTQKCNTRGCPVHCVVSAWAAYGKCSKDCGGGIQSRTRTVKTQPKDGGLKCPSLSMKAVCNTKACPVNCKHSAWSAWGKCSKTCGSGTKSKTRTITQKAANGGKKCENTKTTAACNTKACPIDCAVSSWQSWGGCTKACGSGTQNRRRTITTQVKNGGKACPTLKASRACNTKPCPVNCVVSNWGSWGSCSKTCASGTSRRTRSITTQPKNGGAKCPSPLSENKACNTQYCPTKWTTTAAPGCRSSCQSGAYYAYGGVQCRDAGTNAVLSDSYCTRAGARVQNGKPGKPSRYCGAGPRCGCNNILCGGTCCWFLGGRNPGYCTMCVGGNQHVWPWTCGTSRRCT